MCLTIYMLSHLLDIVVQSLRWKWCEVSMYPNGYQPMDSYQIKYFDHWPYTVATFQMPRNDHVLRRNYCYRMHLKYAQHTQCKNYGPLLFRDAFYEAVSYRMTHSECSFFPIAIFGHVIAIHSLNFWSSSYFEGFLSIKSITMPFIACHAKNCHRIVYAFFRCGRVNSIFDMEWKHLISISL